MKFVTKLVIIPALVFASAISCSKMTPEQERAAQKQKIASIVTKAQTMILDNKSAEAAAVLESAFAKYGDDSSICENLALAYEGMGQYANAGIYYEKAGDLNNEKPDLYLQAAFAYEKANSFSAAIGAYKKHLALDPKNSIAWKSMAKCMEKQNLFEDALNAYLSAVSNSGRSPTSDEAANIGRMFLKLKNRIQARKWLESAFEATAPDNIETRAKILVGLVELYLDAKEMSSLEKAYDQLKAINPELAKTQFPGLEDQINQFNKKLEDAKAAIERAEAEKAAEEKRIEEARLEAIKKAEEEHAAAEAKRLEGEKPVEVETANPLKDLDPMESLSPEAKQQKLVFERLEEDRPADAERIAQAMVSDNPNSPVSWMALSKVHTARGNNRAAYFAAREAAMKDPQNPEPTLLYLHTAAKVLPLEDFIDLAYKARDNFPKNSEILLGLARTYTNIKNYKEARYFYTQFFQHADRSHPLMEDAQKEYAAIGDL